MVLWRKQPCALRSYMLSSVHSIVDWHRDKSTSEANFFRFNSSKPRTGGIESSWTARKRRTGKLGDRRNAPPRFSTNGHGEGPGPSFFSGLTNQGFLFAFGWLPKLDLIAIWIFKPRKSPHGGILLGL